MLLDEATAYADARNEVRIQQALSDLIKDKTVIVIAHRLNTLIHVNHIIVMAEEKSRRGHSSNVTGNPFPLSKHVGCASGRKIWHFSTDAKAVSYD